MSFSTTALQMVALKTSMDDPELSNDPFLTRLPPRGEDQTGRGVPLFRNRHRHSDRHADSEADRHRTTRESLDPDTGGQGSYGTDTQGDRPYTGTLLPERIDPARVWSGLPPLSLAPARALAGRLIVTHDQDPVGTLFDMLRTKLLQALEDRGWSRIVVTAPTRGCGTSFVAANLALSLARRPSCRTLLMDLDLRKPGLAALFGVEDAGRLRDLLTGGRVAEAHLRRLGLNLALALNDTVEPDCGALLGEPETAAAIAGVHDRLAPDVVIYDMPPALAGDDVLAFLPQVDGVLLVTDGTATLAAQVRACEALFAERTQLMGVVLNRAEGRSEPGRIAN